MYIRHSDICGSDVLEVFIKNMEFAKNKNYIVTFVCGGETTDMPSNIICDKTDNEVRLSIYEAGSDNLSKLDIPKLPDQKYGYAEITRCSIYVRYITNITIYV